MSFPDFTDPVLFPTFATIPTSEGQQAPSSGEGGSGVLLAQVKDNMTIVKPTLVLMDREASPFALIFDGLGRDDLDLKGLGFRKGATAVIPGARKTVPEQEGKRPFVRVEEGKAGEVKAIPATLERVLALGARYRTAAQAEGGEGKGCETCGKEGPDVVKCVGCSVARYCGKVS